MALQRGTVALSSLLWHKKQSDRTGSFAAFSRSCCLFLLYGLYRALGRPGMSVALTVVSLGTRVALAYLLSAIPEIGVVGVWWSVPIGWALADLAGVLYYRLRRKTLLP